MNALQRLRANPTVQARNSYLVGSVTPTSQLPRTFMIWTTGRSGSELLTKLLNSHPRIECEGEILQRKNLPPAPAPLRLIRGRSAICTRRTRQADGTERVYGFKVTANDLRWYPSRYPDPAKFVKDAVRDDGLVVVLYRRNYLAQSLSWLHAEATQYHFSGSDSAVEFKPLTVDPEMLLAMTYNFEEYNNYVGEIAATIERKVEFVYEDDLVEPDAKQRTCNAIADALGLPHYTAESELRRVSPASPLDRVANREDVERLFKATRFAALLSG